MAAPRPKNEEFYEEQYGGGIVAKPAANSNSAIGSIPLAKPPSSPGKIQNAQVETRPNYTQPRKFAANTNSTPTQNQTSTQAYSENSEQNSAPSPKQTKKAGFIKQTIKTNLARVRATPIAVTISIWAIPFYLFIQLPIALLAIIFIGVAYTLYILTGTSPATAATAETVTGMTADVFMAGYFIFSLFLLFLNVCQIIVATIQFKIGFIHPWFGRGTAFKLVSIIIILLSSFIPILNLLPLLGLWVLAVILNPK